MDLKFWSNCARAALNWVPRSIARVFLRFILFENFLFQNKQSVNQLIRIQLFVSLVKSCAGFYTTLLTVRTLCSATLSEPIFAKVAELLFIDDLKIFARSQTQLNKILMSTQETLNDIGLDLNPKKCAVANVKGGKQVYGRANINVEATMAIASLKERKSRTGRHNGLGDCRQEIYSVGICHLAQPTF